jgi:hypothetical protein
MVLTVKSKIKLLQLTASDEGNTELDEEFKLSFRLLMMLLRCSGLEGNILAIPEYFSSNFSRLLLTLVSGELLSATGSTSSCNCGSCSCTLFHESMLFTRCSLVSVVFFTSPASRSTSSHSCTTSASFSCRDWCNRRAASFSWPKATFSADSACCMCRMVCIASLVFVRQSSMMVSMEARLCVEAFCCWLAASINCSCCPRVSTRALHLFSNEAIFTLWSHSM